MSYFTVAWQTSFPVPTQDGDLNSSALQKACQDLMQSEYLDVRVAPVHKKTPRTLVRLYRSTSQYPPALIVHTTEIASATDSPDCFVRWETGVIAKTAQEAALKAAHDLWDIARKTQIWITLEIVTTDDREWVLLVSQDGLRHEVLGFYGVENETLPERCCAH